MKARRRHELQHNVLDAELARIIAFLKRRGATIAWCVLIALLIISVGLYVHHRRRRKLNVPQQKYDRLERLAASQRAVPAELLKAFRELADQRDSEQVAAMASVWVGDICLRQYLTDTLLTSPERSDRLREARESYQKVLREFSDFPLATAKARLGLARLAENRRDTATAKAQYEALAAMGDSAGPIVRMLALEGVRRLRNPGDPVRLAATLPASPTTAPASRPAAAPASRPSTIR